MSQSYSRSPAKGAVQYLNQFPKNFLRPYGKQDKVPTEDTVFRRTKPESCEWLVRPKVAASELAETIEQSLESLDDLSGRILLRPSALVKFKSTFDTIHEHVSSFNTKAGGNAKPENVKALLKFLCNDDLDEAIDEAFQIGSSLFVMATQIIVARNFVRNTERYAENFYPVVSTAEEKEFKKSKTVKSLKDMLISYYGGRTVSKAETSSKKKKLFAEIDSDAYDKSEEEPEKSVGKRKHLQLEPSSSETEQAPAEREETDVPGLPVETKSVTDKKRKNKKRKK